MVWEGCLWVAAWSAGQRISGPCRPLGCSLRAFFRSILTFMAGFACYAERGKRESGVIVIRHSMERLESKTVLFL